MKTRSQDGLLVRGLLTQAKHLIPTVGLGNKGFKNHTSPKGGKQVWRLTEKVMCQALPEPGLRGREEGSAS
jgi:hypothetical protein